MEFQIHADGPKLPWFMKFYIDASGIGIALRGTEEGTDAALPFSILVHSAQYLRDVLSGLDFVRNDMELEPPQLLALKNVPAILELLAKASDERATGYLPPEYDMPQNRENARIASANLRGPILALFRELATALNIALEEDSKKAQR